MENIDKLNELIKYIEFNLDQNISDEKMCRILGVNSYTLYRIFIFITGISLTEYIRRRRLSKAALDIINTDKRIIDIAYNYGYQSPEGFSRAFFKFHGINPNEIKRNQEFIKNYPPYYFSKTDENIELNFIIKDVDSFELYGINFECEAEKIKELAPEFWKKTRRDIDIRTILDENVSYSIIQFDKDFNQNQMVRYYVASKSPFKNSKIFKIPESKWAIFKLKNFEDTDYNGIYFDKFSHYVYSNWIPYSSYNIRHFPELEIYYPDGYTEWWLPIE